MAKRNLRRGFWRLAALFWVAGALALLWWGEEARLSPFAEVCREDVDPPYPECLTEQARRLADSRSWTERALSRFRSAWEGIDASKRVPRWQTQRYRTGLRTLGLRLAAWTLFVWGPFYLMVWAFSGFRDPEPPEV